MTSPTSLSHEEANYSPARNVGAGLLAGVSLWLMGTGVIQGNSLLPVWLLAFSSRAGQMAILGLSPSRGRWIVAGGLADLLLLETGMLAFAAWRIPWFMVAVLVVGVILVASLEAFASRRQFLKTTSMTVVGISASLVLAKITGIGFATS